MDRLRKILIGVLILIIIGHLILYLIKEQSLVSSILSVIGMTCLIISISIPKK